jgi:hypothetical protein
MDVPLSEDSRGCDDVIVDEREYRAGENIYQSNSLGDRWREKDGRIFTNRDQPR